ncbi:MAG: glutamate-5-semialdehyde dehydrogenase [Dehalococcoidia bacterium]
MTTVSATELEEKVRAAREAAKLLGRASTSVKDRALNNIAEALVAREEEILSANEVDHREAQTNGVGEAFLDRLLLTPERLQALSDEVKKVAELPDPVGETFDQRTLPNGLRISKRRVPLGVIGAIYESRPNVTVDISILCLKSGNGVVLRGGKEALRSNRALARLVRDSIAEAGVPEDAVQFIESTDRALVERMLGMRGLIDLLVPRGRAELIRFVAERATMPVITGGIGVCHTYVDRSADLDKAVAIAYNAKVRQPSICNALDSLLVHKEIADQYLPMIGGEWGKAGVEMRCDERAMAILKEVAQARAVPCQESDWGKEFLSLVAAVRVVDGPEEAIAHIERYGSGHSEAIVSEDEALADRFLDQVDAAAVFVNASTQFTDGGQFGLGAEVGISTQKMHARGPMGLREMTSYKWVILGQGHTRP